MVEAAVNSLTHGNSVTIPLEEPPCVQPTGGPTGTCSIPMTMLVVRSKCWECVLNVAAMYGVHRLLCFLTQWDTNCMCVSMWEVWTAMLKATGFWLQHHKSKNSDFPVYASTQTEFLKKALFSLSYKFRIFTKKYHSFKASLTKFLFRRWLDQEQSNK